MKVKTKNRLKVGPGLLFIFIVFAVALLPYPLSITHAASCYGSTCTGYNPETMACGHVSSYGPISTPVTFNCVGN